MRDQWGASAKSWTVRLKIKWIRHYWGVRQVALLCQKQVSEEQARFVAHQLDGNPVNSCQDTSTGGTGIESGKQLILKSLPGAYSMFSSTTS